MLTVTRLRALAHLSEKRKRGKRSTSCHDVALSRMIREVEAAEVERLDDNDAACRRDPRNRGKSQPLADYKAKRTLDTIGPAVQAPHKRRRLRTKMCVTGPSQ